MKQLLATLGICMITGLSFAQQNTIFNKQLADSLGADEYGMKHYVFAVLKTGPNQQWSKTELDSLFRGHMNNIKRLAAEGKLIVAGPFGENDKSWRGLFIFNVSKIEEAKALLSTDPAVHAGLFDAELIPWYGSAALPLYLPHHDEVSSKKF